MVCSGIAKVYGKLTSCVEMMLHRSSVIAKAIIFKLISVGWIGPRTIAACKPRPLGLPFVCFLHLPKKLSGTIVIPKMETCYGNFFLGYAFPMFPATGIKFTSGCI